MSLANVMPGDRILVTLKYNGSSCRRRELRLRLDK